MIFHGWGALVGLLGAALIGIGLENIGLARIAAWIIAAVVLFAFGSFINARDDISHRFIWIPIQWWAPVIIIGAIFG